MNAGLSSVVPKSSSSEVCGGVGMGASTHPGPPHPNPRPPHPTPYLPQFLVDDPKFEVVAEHVLVEGEDEAGCLRGQEGVEVGWGAPRGAPPPVGAPCTPFTLG